LDVHFTLYPMDEMTRLTVEQVGFPDDPVVDPFHAECVKGWQDVLQSCKKVIEGAKV